MAATTTGQIVSYQKQLCLMTLHAPVSISVYDRVSHLGECIAALQKNPEAARTVLYIFSDAPRPGDESKIERVRKYVRSIRGFAEIRAVFQSDNSYARNNKQAREIPLNDFGRIIRIEDDIVVSPYFLSYMNEALRRYESDFRVLSISGYLPNYLNGKYDQAFLSKDFSAWGYATWSNRNISKHVDRLDYYEQMIANSERKGFARTLHPLMLPMLRLVSQGKVNPGDYKLSAYQFLTDYFSLKPNVSLVSNIGFDGSGMGGAGKTTVVFDTQIAYEKPEFPEKLDYDPLIDQAFFRSHFPLKSLRIWIDKVKLNTYAFIPLALFRKFLLLKSGLRRILSQKE